MLERMQLFPLNFYKKENFNGSMGRMNFRLGKQSGEEGDVLLGSVWKGPYCYDATPEEKFQRKEFSFSEEGIEEAIAWFNQKGKEYKKQ